MKNHYYVLYTDLAVPSGFDYNIQLQKLLDFEVALQYYDREVLSFNGQIIEPKPIILTNIQNLFRKFKHMLCEGEFRMFCLDKLPFYHGIENEVLGNETLQHFTNIINKEYNFARQFRRSDVWHEEKTGNSYEYIDEEGWKTSDQILESLY